MTWDFKREFTVVIICEIISKNLFLNSLGKLTIPEAKL
jgi:hypothetical protein